MPSSLPASERSITDSFGSMRTPTKAGLELMALVVQHARLALVIGRDEPELDHQLTPLQTPSDNVSGRA